MALKISMIEILKEVYKPFPCLELAPTVGREEVFGV